MANAEHIRLLSQGAHVWNDWREKNPEIIPDFTGFDFLRHRTEIELHPSSAGGERWLDNHWDYHSINLIKVNLTKARFNDSILSRKHLVESDFTGADFTGALMNDTLLKGVNFTDAILRNINLNGARIMFCTFRNAVITDMLAFGTVWKGYGHEFMGAQQTNIRVTREAVK